MTTRGAYVNTWDNEGKLATTKNGTVAAGLNVYDADGNRLLRRNPDTSTTLYLGDTEITLGISTVTPKTSQRWYQFGGKTIATRTSAGLTMLAADHHGTGEAQLDATTNNYIRRKFTPFGGARTGGVVVGWGDLAWRSRVPGETSGCEQWPVPLLGPGLTTTRSARSSVSTHSSTPPIPTRPTRTCIRRTHR